MNKVFFCSLADNLLAHFRILYTGAFHTVHQLSNWYESKTMETLIKYHSYEATLSAEWNTLTREKHHKALKPPHMAGAGLAGERGTGGCQAHSESAAYSGTAKPPALPLYYSNYATSRQSSAPHQTHFISQASLKWRITQYILIYRNHFKECCSSTVLKCCHYNRCSEKIYVSMVWLYEPNSKDNALCLTAEHIVHWQPMWLDECLMIWPSDRKIVSCHMSQNQATTVRSVNKALNLLFSIVQYKSFSLYC